MSFLPELSSSPLCQLCPRRPADLPAVGVAPSAGCFTWSLLGFGNRLAGGEEKRDPGLTESVVRKGSARDTM